MKATNLIILAAAALLGLAGLGCGAGDADFGAEKSTGGGSGGWGGNEVSSAADAAAWGPGDNEEPWEPPPPEEEIDFDFKAPQASEHYVYVAATARDSLVRIDAESLEIRLIPVGGQPTRVATLPAGDVALVINSGTQDFSIVYSEPEDDIVTTLDMLPYVNAISVSPDGEYAIVYYNDEQAAPGEPVGDFQTVAVVSMDGMDGEVAYVSTGFHPTAVFFHQSSPLAYLVTDDGISVIKLDKVKRGDITEIVQVSDDYSEDPSMREVLVTDNGKYAVVRNLALPKVTVVDIHSGDLRYKAVEGLPTDVDLIPGQNQALLLLREQGLAYIADLAAIIEAPPEPEEPPETDDPPERDDPPEDDEEEEEDPTLAKIDIAGSNAGAAVVTRDGSAAVLYTTVGGVKAVTVMDLTTETFEWKAFPVQKAVVGVGVSQQGGTALVLHEAESYAADASELEKTIATTEGFTLFDLHTGYRKLIQTKHRWTQQLFTSGEDDLDLKAYVLTPDPVDLTHYVLSVDLATYIADEILLASSPTSMVFVPKSRKVAVSQDHENGRITFIDVDSSETYSVTGYELNGLIK